MNREEAIKILRETHDKALFSVRNALETLAPELRESKDERIRKMLFEFFSIKNGEEFKWNGFYIKDILAWLEKQKHNQISDEFKTKRSERVFFYQGKECSWEEMPIKERKHNYPYYFDGDIDCYPFVPKKQKERQDNPDAHEGSWQGEISSSRKDTKFDDYLKATPAERRKMNMTEILDEQKPAEWSEKDKTMALTLMRDIEQVPFISKEGKNERIGWLNNLPDNIKPQSSWKPSEDKERMKNDKHFLSICQHLETLISESKNDEAKESIDKDYKWLCEFYQKSRCGIV